MDIIDNYSQDVNEIEEIQSDLEREQRRKERNSESYDAEKEKLLKEQLEGLLKELSESLVE